MNNKPDFVSFYDELPFWSAPFGLELLEQLQIQKGVQALDIGCGTGFPLIEMAQRLGKTCTIHGVDPWKEAMNRVRQKLDFFEINHVKLYEIKAESLPFPDDFFSVIVSNNGLNNIDDIDLVLAECYRTLKLGAQLLFTANLPGTMIEFYTVFEEVLESMGKTESITAMYDHIKSKRKTRQEHESNVNKAGFRIYKITEKYFKYVFADGTTMLNYSFIRLAFLPSWKALVPDQAVMEVFSQVEEKLNRKAEREGQIKLSVPFICMDCRKKP